MTSGIFSDEKKPIESGSRCCVSKETYEDEDSDALFIPNGSKPPPPVKR